MPPAVVMLSEGGNEVVGMFDDEMCCALKALRAALSSEASGRSAYSIRRPDPTRAS